jgi:hypothetical protein
MQKVSVGIELIKTRQMFLIIITKVLRNDISIVLNSRQLCFLILRVRTTYLKNLQFEDGGRGSCTFRYLHVNTNTSQIL